MKSKNNNYTYLDKFPFPNDYLFSFIDPNGGLWIKKINKSDNVYYLGMSSLIAKKLEKIIKIDFYDEHKSEHNLILNEIFCYIKSEDYEIDLFSPLDGNILEINPVFETITIEKPIILTTESIYNENWLLKIKSDKDVSNQTKNWIYPEDKKFSKLVNMIIKGDRVLNERCCPNLLDTKVVRRLEKKNNL